MSESKIQADFHKKLWNTYPKTRNLCYHIPNQAKRTGYAYMIAMGMVPGIPDYHCNFPSQGFNSLYIEFKTDTGKLSDKQIKVQADLRAAGHRVEVARSTEEGLNFFIDYAKGSEFV